MKRLPIRYLEFILSFKLPKTKGVIKIFQKYTKNLAMEQQYKYFAFISYNSHDTSWGKKLQRKLEGYRMPATLCSYKTNNVL